MKQLFFILIIILVGLNLFAQAYEVKAKVNSLENVELVASVQIVDSFGLILIDSMELLQGGLEDKVLTAQNILQEEKSLSYSFQKLSASEIQLSGETNIISALAGRVAGLKVSGQAGAKLGHFGSIMIRGPESLNSFGSPQYIVDGIPVEDLDMIDLDNIEKISILKGINSAVLFGNMGLNGVVLITTKTACKEGGFSVEFNSNTTFDRIAYLPSYQNEYGGGYDGDLEWKIFDYEAGNDYNGQPWPIEWEPLDGQRYIQNGYADESWGAKFDGEPYIAWYNLWPESPYYGETASWDLQPNNIHDFYKTGLTLKNTITVNGSSSKYNARLSYSNINQNGIIPNSTLKKNTISGRLQYNVSDRLSISGIAHFSSSEIYGDFDDSYGNQLTGIFNSSFNRNIDMGKMEELVDLKTSHGYHASWNYWNPSFGQHFDTEKAAFWFNPYFWTKNYVNRDVKTRLISKLEVSYSLNESFSFNSNFSANYDDFSSHFELPSIISNSSDPNLYNTWNNSFGNSGKTQKEYYINAFGKYEHTFGNIGIVSFLGGNVRSFSSDSFRHEMERDSRT